GIDQVGSVLMLALRRILIPTDFREMSDAALTYGLALNPARRDFQSSAPADPFTPAGRASLIHEEHTTLSEDSVLVADGSPVSDDPEGVTLCDASTMRSTLWAAANLTISSARSP